MHWPLCGLSIWGDAFARKSRIATGLVVVVVVVLVVVLVVAAVVMVVVVLHHRLGIYSGKINDYNDFRFPVVP